MKPPIEPTKDDCCNSGCNPCIFDVYENQLKLFKKYQEQGDIPLNFTDFGISQLEYKKFYVLNAVPIGDTHKILYFRNSKYDECLKVWWNPGDHFLFKHTSDNVSCTRAYTPVRLKSLGEETDYDFLIVIKKYIKGLVSNYLYDLNVGEETLWRGPYGTYKLQPNKYSRIIMIAQGTGVAPFISIIQNILNNEEDMTRIVLFYCCSNIIDILFRDELYEFNSFWNFSYKIFLGYSFNPISDDKKYNEPLIFNKLNFTELESLKLNSDDQYLVCGSEKFMKEYESILKNVNCSDNIFLF